MTIDKSADLKKRGVILETCQYASLKTDTIVKSHEYSLCIIEQKGKEVNRTKAFLGKHGTLFHLNKPEWHLKKSLFGGYKKVAFNFINTQEYKSHTKTSAPSATAGKSFQFEGDITYKILNVNMDEWNAWAKKTKFEKNGTVWLTAGGWENLIVNLFFQKGLEALCSKKSFGTFNVLLSQDELNAIAGFVVNQCKRFGFTIECKIEYNGRR